MLMNHRCDNLKRYILKKMHIEKKNMNLTPYNQVKMA